MSVFGDHHPVTLFVGMLAFTVRCSCSPSCRYCPRGYEPAFRFPPPYYFWIAVEVFDRIYPLNGLWANPQGHVQEIALIWFALVVTGLYLAW